MNTQDTRVIYVTASSGPRLSICGYCRKITGKTTVIMSTLFYELVGTEYPVIPEIIDLKFKPEEQCKCMEDVLKGAKVEQH